MITHLHGTLVTKKPTDVVLDVQGVGYEVHIPASSYDKLPAVGQAAKLLTHHHIREDAHLLFGFATEAERTLFRELIGVTGVGPKLALAALSALPPADLRDAVQGGQADLLTRIPGVGKKTAERLVVELRDRFAKLGGLEGGGTLGMEAGEPSAGRADALAALVGLGLGRADAEQRIRKVLRLQAADELLRLALRQG